MSTQPWWQTISPKDLLALRRRVLQQLRQDFPTGELSDYEDATQAAFVGMFVRRDSVTTDDDGLLRWLKAAARNRMLDRHRHAKVRQRPRLHLAPPADRAPPDALAHAERIEKIRAHLAQLDDLGRLVVWKHVVQGVSLSALARELKRDRRTLARILRATFVHVRRLMERER